MDWHPDVRSQKAEDFVTIFLAQYYDARNVERSHGKFWDVCLTLPSGIRKYFEIKTDFKAKETNNLFFEIFNPYRKEPSGLAIVKADKWIHYIPSHHMLLSIDPYALLWYLNMHFEKSLRDNCGDKNSRGYVIPIDFITSREWIDTVSIGG